MRISNIQIFDSALRNILNAQSQVQRTQEQLASGKRVLTPADDPPAAALALRVEQEIALGEQFVRNVDVAQRDLNQEEVQLTSVENILFRLRELVIQSGDGAFSNSERASIITEAQALRESLIGIGNSQLANGEFLFSGFQGDTQPFVTRATGAVEYQGDQGRRFLQISPGVDVEVRDNGRKLFVDIAAANNTFVSRVNALNTGTGDIDTGRIVDQATFDAIFPDDLIITFDNPPSTFSVAQRDHVTGILTPVIAAQPYVAGQAITIGGVEFHIIGTPAIGDEFIIESSTSQSLVDTVQRFITGLQASPDTPAGSIERTRVIAETLNNLDSAEVHIFAARGELGSRLNAIDLAREEHLSVELANREALSDLTDLDFNEAVSNLSFQSFILEAAQQSFARISNLSLFNFLH